MFILVNYRVLKKRVTKNLEFGVFPSHPTRISS